MEGTKAIEDRGGTKKDSGLVPVMYGLRCANCGVSPELAEKIITGGCMYEEEGEWVCSDECYNEYDEKGCPLEERDGHYRKKIKDKENNE